MRRIPFLILVGLLLLVATPAVVQPTLCQADVTAQLGLGAQPALACTYQKCPDTCTTIEPDGPPFGCFVSAIGGPFGADEALTIIRTSDGASLNGLDGYEAAAFVSHDGSQISIMSKPGVNNGETIRLQSGDGRSMEVQVFNDSLGVRCEIVPAAE